MQDYHTASTNNLSHPIPSLSTVKDFHFYCHESKILIHSTGEEIIVPDSQFVDLSDIEEAESYLISLELIDKNDCLIAYYDCAA